MFISVVSKLHVHLTLHTQFQYSILDPHTPTTNINNLRRLGTARGFGFFTSVSTNNDTVININTEGVLANTNRQFFIEDGSQLDLHNDMIVSASGRFAKYTGGSIAEKFIIDKVNDSYEIEISLIEPELYEGDEDEESDDEITIRITSDGYYNAFVAVIEPYEQIGEAFQNPVYDTRALNSSTIGINQGFGYNFPNVTFNPTMSTWQGNQKLIMNDGEMEMFNQVVLRGTGPYRKFVGVEATQDIISFDPNWVTDVTFSATKPSTPDDEEVELDGDTKAKTYDFKLIGGDAGFSDYILDYNTQQEIGNRFQNPVLNPTGKRIGTNQGFRFNFPPDEYTKNKPFYMANRLFQLEDGELNVMNELIVSATGIYSKYLGGYLNETLISSDPFTSEITLVEKIDSSASDDVMETDETSSTNDDVVEEVEDSSGDDIKSGAHRMEMTTYKAAAWSALFWHVL